MEDYDKDLGDIYNRSLWWLRSLLERNQAYYDRAVLEFVLKRLPTDSNKNQPK